MNNLPGIKMLVIFLFVQVKLQSFKFLFFFLHRYSFYKKLSEENVRSVLSSQRLSVRPVNSFWPINGTAPLPELRVPLLPPKLRNRTQHSGRAGRQAQGPCKGDRPRKVYPSPPVLRSRPVILTLVLMRIRPDHRAVVRGKAVCPTAGRGLQLLLGGGSSQKAHEIYTTGPLGWLAVSNSSFSI